jgi:hypothetical protein
MRVDASDEQDDDDDTPLAFWASCLAASKEGQVQQIIKQA